MSDKQNITPDAVFARLSERLKGKPDLMQRVNAHIQAISGHPHLLAYHNNGSPDGDKIATYGKCLAAVTRGDFSALEGQIPSGQAKAETEAGTEPEQEPAPEEAAAETRAADPAPKPEKRASASVRASQCRSAAPPPAPGSLESVIAAAIAPFIQRQAQPAPSAAPDPESIRSLIKEQLTDLRAELSGKVDAYLAKVPPREAIRITQAGKTAELQGVFHWQLPQLVTWVAADVPVWLWGQAGGGKTHLGRQIAAALETTATIISIDPTITVGKLLGYRNLATGDFVEGFLLRPYRDGGLVMLDEIDTGDPGILAALNALLANDYYLFPNGETIKRHDQFRVIAGANTRGVGAIAGYSARNRLDAATLDRFAVIELEYDTDLEMALATGMPKPSDSKGWTPGEPWLDAEESVARSERWVRWVQSVRKTVGNSVLVSPRASILGVRALKCGVPAREVADALLYKLCTPDTRKNIINHCGEFAP